MAFFKRLAEQQNKKKSSLCVGLDPNPEKFPQGFSAQNQSIYEFCWQIVQATEPYACAFKPQIAYFAGLNAEDVLQQLIKDIAEKFPDTPVVLDAKRGDIDASAAMYAKEAFERYGAHAVTVNPYMGIDTVKPFADYKDRGVFLLCRTSNPGAAETQNLELKSGKTYFEHIAELALKNWNTNDNIGLVVGATAIAEMATLRKAHPRGWFLVPGVGFQGGSLPEVMAEGGSSKGGGVLINSSRGILYASAGEDFAEAAANKAKEMQLQMQDFF